VLARRHTNGLAEQKVNDIIVHVRSVPNSIVYGSAEFALASLQRLKAIGLVPDFD